jgi:hypothetical protein
LASHRDRDAAHPCAGNRCVFVDPGLLERFDVLEQPLQYLHDWFRIDPFASQDVRQMAPRILDTDKPSVPE